MCVGSIDNHSLVIKINSLEC